MNIMEAITNDLLKDVKKVTGLSLEDIESLKQAFEKTIGSHLFNPPPHATVNSVMLNSVPYQKCPKCDGQGTVSKPPYVPGDVNQWVSNATTFTCDVCAGKKIIAQTVLPESNGTEV